MSNRRGFKVMPDQMPGWLSRLDDPWGVTWRVKNLRKRFSLATTAKLGYALARGIRYSRPVFVLGAPRSGTTMLFQLLKASDELAGLPGEGHDLWRLFHHPRRRGWRSDEVGAGEVRPGERRFVNAYFYAHIGTQRLVEKTPENCLRIPYLLDLFPDAVFLIIKRDPCDVVNSLINGWRHPQGLYRSYYVPHELRIPGYDHRHRWCFALIDGWRNYAASPVPEIAFAQWRGCSDAVAAGRDLVPPRQWFEIHFEHLISAPDDTLRLVCERLGLSHTSALQNRLAALLAEPVNALSAPRMHKWRYDNEAEIRPLLPRIAAAASAAGYSIDQATGDARPLELTS